MSFPPFDSSAPTHTPPPPRPAYGQQPQYAAYDQPAYGALGFGDLSHQPALRYPSAPGLAYPQNEQYMPPSFSPTASQFAAHAYAPGTNPDAMSYPAHASPRRRYQSTGGALQSPPHPGDSRYPAPRRPSAEMHMQETFEFVPSQQPDPRPGPTYSSSSDSALALEKPYECDICHTRFARQHDCRRHRETHAVNASGEKPHHCVVCGKSFTRKDALKRHTNQKGCDTAMGGVYQTSSRSSRSSASPQQSTSPFYPIGSLPHGSSGQY
ncbi:hypothetical protein FRC06_001194 [Ceratobasidium sp. 370]|nr:hypothetical protein FRC06_001194 [Ceratobasidium sp. 370]